MSEASEVKAFALDLAERAGSTFWQAAAPVLAGAQLTDWTQTRSLLVAAAVAGGSAVLSLVKGVLAGLRTGTASTSKRVATASTPVGVTVTDA